MNIQELKRDFFKIRSKYLYGKITAKTSENLMYELHDLFRKHGLLDLKYTLDTNVETGMIELKPLRNIDKLAIYALLS